MFKKSLDIKNQFLFSVLFLAIIFSFAISDAKIPESGFSSRPATLSTKTKYHLSQKISDFMPDGNWTGKTLAGDICTVSLNTLVDANPTLIEYAQAAVTIHKSGKIPQTISAELFFGGDDENMQGSAKETSLTVTTLINEKFVVLVMEQTEQGLLVGLELSASRNSVQKAHCLISL